MMKKIAQMVFILWVVSTFVQKYCLANQNEQQKTGDYYYLYFHQKRPLKLNTGKIAIRRDEVSQQRGLPALPIDAAGEKPLPVDKWSLFDTPAATHTDKGVNDLVAQAVTQHGIKFISPVFIGDNGGDVIITDSILVGFTPQTDVQQVENILGRFKNLTIAERNWANMNNVYRLVSSSKNGFDVLDAANVLAQLPEASFAEPDVIFTGRNAFIPNESDFYRCWGIHNTGQVYIAGTPAGTHDMDMDGPEAWDITLGDDALIVVVIDTGIQQDHPDIHQRPGADFTGDGGSGGPVNQYDNHGTPVAGCVSAIANNGTGTVGIAPACLVASAKAFRATDSSGRWYSVGSWTVNALAWAESIGARVTNNSNGYDFTSSSIATKYEQTRNNGIVHFASAGNDSSSTLTYPASLPTVNAVTALNSSGNLASFSNYGTGLAFSAPGLDIYTTDRTGSDGWSSGDYTWAWGTSFASPYAAGIAALILSVDPSLTAAEVEQIMQQTCIDRGSAGYDTTYGWGFVNAYNAVLEAAAGIPLADLDGDGAVDFKDFAILASQWLQTSTGLSADIAPVDGDNIVNYLDLFLLADQWLIGK